MLILTLNLILRKLSFYIFIHTICPTMNYMTYCITLYVISQVKITKNAYFLRKFSIFCKKHTFFAKILHFLRKFQKYSCRSESTQHARMACCGFQTLQHLGRRVLMKINLLIR